MSNYFVSLIPSLSWTDSEELLIFPKSNNKITIKTMLEIVLENLVKLYGCCAEGNHRILVYNYLENKSLAHALLGSS